MKKLSLTVAAVFLSSLPLLAAEDPVVTDPNTGTQVSIYALDLAGLTRDELLKVDAELRTQGARLKYKRSGKSINGSVNTGSGASGSASGSTNGGGFGGGGSGNFEGFGGSGSANTGGASGNGGGFGAGFGG